MSVNVTIGEDSFDGEILTAFETDPFGLGHFASGSVIAAVGELRRCAKATAGAAGIPQPTSYKLSADAKDGKISIGFSAE